jgi:Mg/Co/Ni transporter MgtE
MKMEEILTDYENSCDKNDVENSLGKCILSINKLDKKEHFIGTIEVENIIDKIMEINRKHNFDENIIEKIIEENREW